MTPKKSGAVTEVGEADFVGAGFEEEEAPIGPRLAELRKQHRFSIRKLAQRAGVSPSLISDIERGKVEPSISALKRLSAALGTNLTYFFSQPAKPASRVIKASERTPIGGDDGRAAIEARGVRLELASPEQAEQIEAIYGRYDVGASVGEESLTHEGEEWGIVLSGRLKVWVGDEIHFLDPGDSIWFPSSIPHRMANVADEPTEYVWVDTPKSF